MSIRDFCVHVLATGESEGPGPATVYIYFPWCFHLDQPREGKDQAICACCILMRMVCYVSILTCMVSHANIYRERESIPIENTCSAPLLAGPVVMKLQ